MKRIVGKVTATEKDMIQSLFERRNGLIELSQILSADNSELYERIVKDLGVTTAQFQNWWSTMAEKYSWESAENGHWEINFESCEISLVSPD